METLGPEAIVYAFAEAWNNGYATGAARLFSSDARIYARSADAIFEGQTEIVEGFDTLMEISHGALVRVRDMKWLHLGEISRLVRVRWEMHTHLFRAPAYRGFITALFQNSYGRWEIAAMDLEDLVDAGVVALQP